MTIKKTLYEDPVYKLLREQALYTMYLSYTRKLWLADMIVGLAETDK